MLSSTCWLRYQLLQTHGFKNITIVLSCRDIRSLKVDI